MCVRVTDSALERRHSCWVCQYEQSIFQLLKAAKSQTSGCLIIIFFLVLILARPLCGAHKQFSLFSLKCYFLVSTLLANPCIDA